MMGTPEGEEWKAEFRPLLPDVKSINFNSFEDLSEITERTAGVLCEVVQGEAGVRLPNPEWLKALRERCTEVGALLIFDEIQTGMGRTGEMFACAKYGIQPDVVCLAKAFGGGMPLGGVAANKQILDSFTNNPYLGHITTFGGHPVCCAAGLAALNYLKNNNIVESVEDKGALFESLIQGHDRVLEIRRSGLLLAVELGKSEYLYRLMEIFKEEGIMSDWFLYCDTAFRISPPLTISEPEIRECCNIILRSLDRL
jgi:acetylornithine/succinyldiaminopimelate/putrescine aminotransferase